MDAMRQGRWSVRTCALVLMPMLLAVVGAVPCLACNPEPGPNHFPPPGQVEIPVGYFELHNTLTGLPCNNIRSLLALDGLVFAGTEGEGLLVWRGGEWRQFTPASDPPFPAPTVSCFLKVSDSLILAGTPLGVVHLTDWNDPAKMTFRLVVPQGPLGPDILALSAVPAGKDLLAGTFYGAGLLLEDRLEPYRIQENIPPTGFSSIRTQGQVFWFGSSDGLLELQGRSLRTRTWPPHEFGWVQALESDGKDLFIGGAKGLFVLNTDVCREILPGIWTTALAMTPGVTGLFAGGFPVGLEVTPGAVKGAKDSAGALDALRVVKEMNQRYQQIMAAWNQGTLLTSAYEAYLRDLGNLSPKVNASLLKGLWVGTQDSGVILYTADGQRRHLTRANSKMPSDRVTAISALESGETWIGTYDGGLLRYRRYLVKPADAPEPVFTGAATTLRVVGDTLYVGTRSDGLYVFNTKTLAQLNRLHSGNLANFHGRVSSLAADRDGTVWVAGNAGLWRLGGDGMKRFTTADGLPALETELVTTDQDGRVYVAVKAPGKSVSEHLAGYNGEGFTSYSVKTLQAILAMAPADRTAALRAMGLLDSYQQAFDTGNASAALRAYDPGTAVERVTALLGTPHLLMIGTEAGQYVFDGSGFKPMHVVGPAAQSQVIAYGKRGNGTIVTMGPDKITLFDGRDFSPVFDCASPTVAQYTGLDVDDMNTDLFWACFTTPGGGAFGLYQNPKWDAVGYEKPILAIARAFPYVFALCEDGVWRFTL